jgi:hypothetical protein
VLANASTNTTQARHAQPILNASGHRNIPHAATIAEDMNSFQAQRKIKQQPSARMTQPTASGTELAACHNATSTTLHNQVAMAKHDACGTKDLAQLAQTTAGHSTPKVLARLSQCASGVLELLFAPSNANGDGQTNTIAMATASACGTQASNNANAAAAWLTHNRLATQTRCANGTPTLFAACALAIRTTTHSAPATPTAAASCKR